MEIFKQFNFDAAHQLACNVPSGHKYEQVHGHSFSVDVFIKGVPDPEKYWVVDFDELDQSVRKIHEALDHKYLNDIDGLEVPTLERICEWIWDRLYIDYPGISRVIVKRGTIGEGCIYEGPSDLVRTSQPKIVVAH